MGAVPTSIIPPRAVRTVVERHALSRLTDAIDRSRVTTVCAPAGSGKTTAMLHWADQFRAAGRPLLWLAARAGISDMQSFLWALEASSAAAGLANIPGADRENPAAWLHSFASHGVSSANTRPVLVIDDAQFLPKDVLDFIAQIVASARDGLTTMIAARGTSQIPIARMRALGFLVEVTYTDLCWSLEEATELVTRTVGAPVDAADLQQIVIDTQGWVAGVAMASDLYRQEKQRNARAISCPTGLRHEFTEYFHEEVLGLQPQDLRNFLVDTSILDELTPSACAAVSGGDEARAMLDRVYSAGLFLNATDREHSCYSYHKLFRTMVLGRLMDRAPARAAELHRRASRFFADEGKAPLALDHAELSRDETFLADQLERLAEDLTFSGYLYRIDELGSPLPWKTLSTRPLLLLALAWRRTRTLAFTSAEKLIQAARAHIDAEVAAERYDHHEADRLNNIIRHRRIMLDAARDHMVDVEHAAEGLLTDLGDDHAYLSCTLLAQLMSARRELYHFHDMLKLEAETRKALGRPGSQFASIALKASVAPTLMAQGKTQFARQFLEESLELAKSIQGDGSGLAALPALPMAELMYECGQLEEAGQLVERYMPSVRQWGFVDQLASGYLVRARLATARGDVAAALSGLQEAHVVAIECGLDRLRAFVVAEQVRILIKAGHIEEAERAYLAGDPHIDGEPVPTLHPTRRNESIAVAWLRIEMQRHRLVRARKVAKRWLEFVKRSGAVRSAVTFELLLAEIAVLQGNRSEARRAVRAAVELAEPAGWTRVFIDEGEVIASLMTEAYAQGPALESPADRFAATLVSLMHGGPALETDDEDDGEFGLGSRLASREIDILNMVSGGLRNREIGDRLGLTEGTVKWYMQQIYDKLGVRRRPQAVIRARQLGLLP
jgi:LuxR family maltose regulon positive regulatory protein